MALNPAIGGRPPAARERAPVPPSPRFLTPPPEGETDPAPPNGDAVLLAAPEAALLAGLEDALALSWALGPVDAERIERRILGEVDAAMRTVDASTAAPRALRRLRAFREQVDGRLAAAIRAVLDDPRAPELRGAVSLLEALRAHCAGVRFADLDPVACRDGDLDPLHPPRTFGAPGREAPVLLTRRDGGRLVFKPEPDPFAASLRGGSGGTPGVAPARARPGNRCLAAHAVARALGSSAIPRAALGVHAGTVGLVVELAEGRTAAELLPRLPRLDRDQLASLLDGLHELEWLDVLTGQPDRNPSNLRVELGSPTVTVTGVDEDLCFVRAPLDADGNAAPAPLPDLVGARIARRIHALDFERELLPCLAGRLSDAEIDAAAARCFAAKKRVARLAKAGCVVEDWARWRTDVDGRAVDAARYLLALARNPRRRSGLFVRVFGAALVHNRTLRIE